MDSIRVWKQNKIMNVEISKWYVDSVIAFNNDTSRLITAYFYNNEQNVDNDGMCFILGERINNNWFFLKTTGIFIPREMVKDQPKNKPLTYKQLHQIALKEVFGNYLKPNGEINEDFFTREFEGPGWLNYGETAADLKKLTRKDFEQRHLQYVKNNWNFVKKDTSSTLQ